MNWLQRAPPPIALDEQLIVCPLCKGDRPKASVTLLRSYVRRRGVYVGIIDGERLACQECGGLFSLDYRRGVFQHDPRAHPFLGAVPLGVIPEASVAAPGLPAPLALRPTPRERKSGV